MVKILSFALAIGIVLYVFFYLPKQLKKGRSARIRYVIGSIIACLFAFALLKIFH